MADMTARAFQLVHDINSLPSSSVIIAMGYTDHPREELLDLLNYNKSDDQVPYTIEEFALASDGNIRGHESILLRIAFEVYMNVKLLVQEEGVENTFFHYLKLSTVVYIVDYTAEDLCVPRAEKHGHNVYEWCKFARVKTGVGCQEHNTTSPYSEETVRLLEENTMERQILSAYAIAREGADYGQAMRGALAEEMTKARSNAVLARQRRDEASRDKFKDELAAVLAGNY